MIMKKAKLSLANVQGMLSKDQMKAITAGSGSPGMCQERYDTCGYQNNCCNGLICDSPWPDKNGTCQLAG